MTVIDSAEALVEPELSMYERRPPWLDLLIESRFQDVSTTEKPAGYVRFGDERKYVFSELIPGVEIDTDGLVGHLRQPGKKSLEVLEFGCGAGAFIDPSNTIWEPGDRTQGITAHDWRPNPTEDPNYFVANGENLSKIEGLLPRFDLIVSNLTLVWLVDPLGAFEQLCNRLKPGGLIVYDGALLPLPAGERRMISHDDVYGQLQRSGFDLMVDPSKLATSHDPMYALLPALIKRTGDRPVRFNVDYTHIGGEDWMYSKLQS